MNRRTLLVSSLTLSVALFVGVAPLRSQAGEDARPDYNAIDKLARAARIAQTGDLGFPPLPDVTADTPDDTIFYGDRMPFGTKPPADEIIKAVTLVDFDVPSSLTGTGYKEIIQYQLPDLYDEFGTPHPLVVAYHGFGGSAGSVALLSTLDEECNTRNWVYLSVTGLDDQLFGTPDSQQNTEAGIQYILDNVNVDPDRIYMVGFSVGGGISGNFAARRRDPDGVMIAALGLVSATADWALEYTIGVPDLKAWLDIPENFGGPPSTELFRYQQASSLYFDSGTYPPATLAVADLVPTMATNLAEIPTYITYDIDDSISHVPHMCEEVAATLLAIGGTVQITTTSGTVAPGPPVVPAPHSWHVLDEVALFDFFDGKSVNRQPADFEAQLDLGGPVSWLTTTQRQSGVFVYADGSVDVPGDQITVDAVLNASAIEVDVAAAGLVAPLPIRVTVTNDDSSGALRLTIGGLSEAPHRLHDAATGSLIALVDSDPTGGTLSVDIPASSTLDVDVVHDPKWLSVFTTTPNPVPIGTSVSLDGDGVSTSTIGLLIFATHEQLLNVGGGIIVTAWPLAPSVRFVVLLDTNGDFSFSAAIPNDPGLIGSRLPVQLVTLDAGSIQSVSNLWGMAFE